MRQFANSEEDAAALHHAQEDFLLLGRVVPYQRFEIGPTKAPVAPEQRQYFVPVEERVDGFQGPVLVEDDEEVESNASPPRSNSTAPVSSASRIRRRALA
jgi:hypothetical protein